MNALSKLLLLMFVITPTAFGATQGTADQAAAAPAASEQYKPKAPQINRAKLDELLAKPDQLLIIDLRRPDEIASVGGFQVYLNIQATELENHLAFIPKDRSIVTVSNHAGRSGKSADLLADKGFKVAGWLGAKYYEEEGGKLIKIAPSTPNPQASIQ